jgi:hypothetical protein
MRTPILLFICLLSLGSCKKKTEPDTGSLLRIENRGNLLFDSVKVQSPGGSHVYYNIGATSFSGYQKFNFLYRYAYIAVYFGNRTAILQPFDYVGEKILDTGKHTYRLTILQNLTSDYVNLEYKKD